MKYIVLLAGGSQNKTNRFCLRKLIVLPLGKVGLTGRSDAQGNETMLICKMARSIH